MRRSIRSTGSFAKVVCGQCGSVNLVEAKPKLADRVIRIVTSRRPILCRRCGWRARRSWTADDLRRRSEYGAGGAEPDPSLSVLDRDLGTDSRSRQFSSEKLGEGERFDLGQSNVVSQDDTFRETQSPSATRVRPKVRQRRSLRRRRNKSSRREVLATVAATAFVLFSVALFALAGSCVGVVDA